MEVDLSQNALVAIGLIVLLILAVNLGLWAVWKRRDERQQGSWLSRMSKTLRSPWQAEQSNMQELTRRLTELRRSVQPNSKDPPSDLSPDDRMD
jgi:cytochrome c-type biogenesis protein CcmH/NrfG